MHSFFFAICVNLLSWYHTDLNSYALFLLYFTSPKRVRLGKSSNQFGSPPGLLREWWCWCSLFSTICWWSPWNGREKRRWKESNSTPSHCSLGSVVNLHTKLKCSPAFQVSFFGVQCLFILLSRNKFKCKSRNTQTIRDYYSEWWISETDTILSKIAGGIIWWCSPDFAYIYKWSQ